LLFQSELKIELLVEVEGGGHVPQCLIVGDANRRTYVRSKNFRRIAVFAELLC